MNNKEEPMEGERGVAILGAAICFLIFSALAIFAIGVADNVPLWIRAAFLVAAVFFGWLLLFAPAPVRVAVIRWFPWG